MDYAAQRRAHILRLADELVKWADDDSDWQLLRVLDAVLFTPLCDDLQTEDRVEWWQGALRLELRIDDEGYPLNGEGDRIIGADRKYVPLVRLEGDGA